MYGSYSSKYPNELNYDFISVWKDGKLIVTFYNQKTKLTNRNILRNL